MLGEKNFDDVSPRAGEAPPPSPRVELGSATSSSDEDASEECVESNGVAHSGHSAHHLKRSQSATKGAPRKSKVSL